ncbi:MAG: SIS domain-containing protein [Candidatus Poribacteria bacterium]|nr:SIS domain-containing protein [Candidatus Poribacteria bacterium]
MDILHSIRDALLDAQDVLNRFIQNPDNITIIAETAALMRDVFEQQGRIFTCGNGGSMCDAIHFAEECTGKFRHNRKPLPVIALSDTGHITCTANDFGFAEVFARPLLALGHPDDLLVVLSTSGNSENIVRAAAAAKSRQMHVFGLIGRDGGKLKHHCDKFLIAPGKTADRIQEIHIKVLHILIEHVERLMFPENY